MTAPVHHERTDTRVNLDEEEFERIVADAELAAVAAAADVGVATDFGGRRLNSPLHVRVMPANSPFARWLLATGRAHKDTTGPSRDFGGVCVPIRLAPLDFPAWPAAQVTTAWAPTRAYAQAYRQTLRDHDIAAQVEYAA